MDNKDTMKGDQANVIVFSEDSYDAESEEDAPQNEQFENGEEWTSFTK
jgi:hypothetical protein